MKISYDAEVDALSITFRETTVTTKHLGEGIATDYDWMACKKPITSGISFCQSWFSGAKERRPSGERR